MVDIWHYDGKSAKRHEGTLSADSDGFLIAINGEEGVSRYQWSDLTYQSPRDDMPSFGHHLINGWRIIIRGELSVDIADNLPTRANYGRWIDRVGIGKASAIGLAASAALIVLIINSPALIAPLIPKSVEMKLGEAMVGDFGGRFCSTPTGNAALAAMVKRIEPNSADLKIHVANINMVNAVALPGNHVIIFRGLLQQAKNPDEVTGVLGHEIGHVRNHDVMEAMIRQMGLGLLLSSIGGDATGYAEMVLSASYSRDAEADADDFSIKSMSKGKVSPLGTAGFFDGLAQMESAAPDALNTVLKYISTHPESDKRRDKYKASHNPNTEYPPSLTADEWRALVDMCKDDPKMKPDGEDLFF
jgi:beta-barrel assembly-enhancing protease